MSSEGRKQHPLEASRKSLTSLLGSITIIGTLVLGLLWWDSTRYDTTLTTKNHSWSVAFSCFNFDSSPFAGGAITAFEYHRISVSVYRLDFSPKIFPAPQIRDGFSIPIYLVLLTYLATLLLIWLVMMNCIARRAFLAQATGINKT